MEHPLLFDSILSKAQAAVNLEEKNDFNGAKLQYREVVSQLQEVCANNELSEDQITMAEKHVRRI